MINLLKARQFLLILLISTIIQEVNGQCSCPDSIRSKYRYAAAQSVLQTAILTNNKSVTDSGFIPESATKKMLDGICALYKNSGGARDSVFLGLCGFEYSFFTKGRNINEITIEGDASIPELQNLATGKASGNSKLDNLITKYGFKVNLRKILSFYYGTMKTDSLINPLKIIELILDAQPLLSAYESNMYGDGSSWYAYPRGDTMVYTFTYAWGDCQAGCMFRRSWHFYHYGKCNISKPYYSTPPPVIPWTGIKTGRIQNMVVFPNPATSTLYADVRPQTVYTIRDFTGKTLLTGHYQSGINTQSLLTGIYTIEFSGQRGKAVFQVLRP